MQYMNSSFRYIGRHFWRMLLYFILPAIVLGAANSPVSLIKLLTQSDFGDSLSFDEVFLGASDLTDGWRVALVVLGFILYVVFASAAVGSIQHKMRYGEFYPVSARRFFRKVNANAIAITLGMVALMIMVELLGFFVSVFVFFWSQVMSGAAALAMSAVTVVVGSACFMIVATMFVLVIPNMTVKGYGFFTAIRRSVPVACKNFGRLLAAVVIRAQTGDGRVVLSVRIHLLPCAHVCRVFRHRGHREGRPQKIRGEIVIWHSSIHSA